MNASWPGFEANDAKPFISWPIETKVRPDAPERIIDYPDGDAGPIAYSVGRILIDPAAKRIVLDPDSGIEPNDIHVLLSAALNKRSGDMGFPGLRPEMLEGLTEPFEVAGHFARTENVVRCGVLGCDDFGDWHRADFVFRDKSYRMAGEHVACDQSTEAFRCRLLFRSGRWRVDIGTKVRFNDDVTANAAALTAALAVLSERAAELNDMESAVRSLPHVDA
ncbi:hypothetical protein [Pseudolysinimonas sp.]